MPNEVSYKREILVEVLVYHYRANIESCGCGFSELGKSHPEHVADVYEASVALRSNPEVASVPAIARTYNRWLDLCKCTHYWANHDHRGCLTCGCKEYELGWKEQA